MSQEVKDKSLVSQETAVADYLNALLTEPPVEEQKSVSRAAQSIVHQLVDEPESALSDSADQTINTVVDDDTSAFPEEPVVEAMQWYEEDDLHEVEDNSEALVLEEAPEPAAIDQDFEDPIVEASAPDDEVETELPEVSLEMRDCSEDPEVVAEAEKMLSYVFPQPQAEKDTPLRKLQDAGIVSVTPQNVVGNTDKTYDGPTQLIPSFAADRFTVMGFRVSRLNMMVSVTELRNVEKPDGELRPIFGKPNWLLEYTKVNGAKSFVVDGTELFVPEGAVKLPASDLEEHYIIWLLEGRVGILCDEIQQMSDLNKRQVTWRGSKAQRPWLAGTIRSMRSVLIDGETVCSMVDEQF